MSVDEAAAQSATSNQSSCIPIIIAAVTLLKFKDLVGKDGGVAVRVRYWY
jgi:hypothetical protein